MCAEKLRAFHADGPITKSRAFGRAGNDTDVVGHDLTSDSSQSDIALRSFPGRMEVIRRKMVVK